MRLAVYS